MALASTVSGDGKPIELSQEVGSVEMAFMRGKVAKIRTIYYTESRIARKWYALTAAAIDTWAASHVTSNFTATCTNEILNAWELTVYETSRIITGWKVTDAPEGEP